MSDSLKVTAAESGRELHPSSTILCSREDAWPETQNQTLYGYGLSSTPALYLKETGRYLTK